MKKSLFMSLFLGALFVGVYLFIPKAASSKLVKPKNAAKALKHKTSCNGGLYGSPAEFTSVSYDAYHVTFTVTPTGSYDHLNYGGYFNTTHGPINIPSTDTYSNTITVSTGGATSGRVGVNCICADGSVGTGGSPGTHGIYYTVGGSWSTF